MFSITKKSIFKCGLLLHLVEQSTFRNFLKDLNIKTDPLSVKKIKRVAIPIYINNTNDICLTIDGWSDRRC